MVITGRKLRAGRWVLFTLLACLPAMLGQACPQFGPPVVRPILGVGTPPGVVGGNTTFTFLTPATDVSLQLGDVFEIRWSVADRRNLDGDPANNVTLTITFLLRKDDGSGTEIPVTTVTETAATGTPRSTNIDTGASNLVGLLQEAPYFVIARILTSANEPELVVAASGRLIFLGAGLIAPSSRSPTVYFTQPAINRGVTAGDSLEIVFCAADADNGGTGQPPAADTVLILDNDANPLNDIDLTLPIPDALTRGAAGSGFAFDCVFESRDRDGGVVDQQLLIDLIRGISSSGPTTVRLAATQWVQTILSRSRPNGVTLANLPPAESVPPGKCRNAIAWLNEVRGTSTLGSLVLIHSRKEADCTGAANTLQSYTFTVDPAIVSLQESGAPYHIRASVYDRNNPPVHAYAPGTLSVGRLGSGTIDLGDVGRTLSGTRFLGFDALGRTGSNGCGVGDIDGDGIDDFVIVSQFGGATNAGGAHIVMGLPNRGRFGSEIMLNSISTRYRGAILTLPVTTGTMGIMSVSRIGDVSGDGKPDILFGLPYHEIMPDDLDDDPVDCGGDAYGCYTDRLPNPFSDPEDMDDITTFFGCPYDDCLGASDHREGFVQISEDPPIVRRCSTDLDFDRFTPIDGGYAIIVASENNLTSSVLGLDTMGQRSGVPGARFRGAWYERDATRTVLPSWIVPDNQFALTVASMPSMTNTSLSISPRYGSTLLLSAPRALEGRGMVLLVYEQNLTSFRADGAQSFPVYEPGPGDCPTPSRSRVYPSYDILTGASIGDEFGYAAPAGDYNLDGSRDLLLGAPGADRNGLEDAGILYILFGRPDFGRGVGGRVSDPNNLTIFDPVVDMGITNPPRMEIRGTQAGMRLGEIQTIVGDVNLDGLPDIGFAAPYYDGPGGVDSGYVGIVFGGRRLTGENLFTVDQVATPQLPGVRFFGTQPGGLAGMVLNNVGDFNGDSREDFIIVAPNEVRTVNGTPRRGVAYLIFGNSRMVNRTFNLSQVGSAELPGLVLISPYVQGSAEEAPIEWANGAGDINADGFADLLIGLPRADYVNPIAPSQRRIDSGEMYLIYGSNVGANAPPP